MAELRVPPSKRDPSSQETLVRMMAKGGWALIGTLHSRAGYPLLLNDPQNVGKAAAHEHALYEEFATLPGRYCWEGRDWRRLPQSDFNLFLYRFVRLWVVVTRSARQTPVEGHRVVDRNAVIL